MHILITGAGIGGLTAAIALDRAGHSVTLAERLPAFEAVGAGIVLAPNAARILASLDVDLASVGRRLSRSEVRTAAGTALTTVDMAALAGRFGPTYAIARPDLHAALVEALPASVTVRLGRTVGGLREEADGVTVDWADGPARFDLAVAADGLHSVIRDATHGPQRLRYSGTTCWRGIAEFDGGDTAIEAWGGRARVGIVPIGAGRTYYYLVLTAPPRAPQPAWPDGFRTAFAGFGGAPGELIAALTEAPPLHHDLFELDRPVWGRGRVLLLGDAAHAMTPNQGQGAAMAIEDSAALTLALRTGPKGADRRYRTARETRVRKVQLNSRRIGAVAHWRRPPMTWLRNGAILLTPGSAGARALESLVRPGVELAGESSAAGGPDRATGRS